MLTFKYRHIIKKTLKHIYITIDHNGEIILKSSPQNALKAKEVLKERSDWIEKKLKVLEQKDIKTNIYKDGGVIYYLGKSYPLVFKKSEKKDMVEFRDGCFIYQYYKADNCQKRVEEFYKKEAKKIYSKKIKHFSKRLGLYPKEIKFRKAKRRLGSCSYDNVLNFNYFGIKLTPKEIDYIVVHELAHIKEKNHSKRFWDIVKKEFPNYKELRKNITLSL